MSFACDFLCHDKSFPSSFNSVAVIFVHCVENCQDNMTDFTHQYRFLLSNSAYYDTDRLIFQLNTFKKNGNLKKKKAASPDF